MADNKSMTMKMDAKPQAASDSGNRVIYLDLLRIVAAFAVVMLHVTACQGHWWDSCFGAEWIIRDVYNACTRWCVPVFVMISGALFLDSSKELNVKRLYTKNVVHILQAFVLWSLIYVFLNIGLNMKPFPKITRFAASVVGGEFHMWFLKMLLGLYIAIPILKAIVSNKKVEMYFICLSVITCFLLPMLFRLIRFLGNGLGGIEFWYNTMEIKIALGYTGYFVLGHFCNTYALDARIKRVIYWMGGLSVVCVIILTYVYSVRILGKNSELFMEYLTPFTLCEALAVFLLVKQKICSVPAKCHSFIVRLSKMTFGIYLVHVLVMNILGKFGLNSQTFHPSFFIPCLSLIVFGVSYVITRILYSIPYLRKLVL